MSKLKKNVLVLDGEQFSSLSIVRSLGSKGLNVTVGASNDDAICKHSKYTNSFFQYPDPLVDIDEFYQYILEKITDGNFELLIPVTEHTTIPLAKIREKIEVHTVLALPSDEALENVTNKSKTFEIAESIGVPIPKSIEITNEDTFNLKIDEINFPVVIKPSRSIVKSKNDSRIKLEVTYAFNKKELREKVMKFLSISDVILQEYFTGVGVGIEFIANNGEIVHAFQHERIHELPLTGGGSCLRKSVIINEKLLNYARLLSHALKWHGVAMVEFKYSSNGNIALMEINGRFWGSLPLAVSSGSDFPWYLYQLLVDQKNPDKFISETGHISRKMKNDLYWYLQVIFRKKASPLFIRPTNYVLMKDFMSVLYYKHHFDTFSWRDVKPGLIELKRTTIWFYNFTKGFLIGNRLKRKHRIIRKNNLVQKILTNPSNILFICYGNINRSAAAECIINQNKESTPHLIKSAGFHKHDSRLADSNMVTIAKGEGYEMSNWSSTTINKKMVDDANVIFVMEIEHILKLTKLYPNINDKVYLLSSLNKNSNIPLEISDPYGKEMEIYRNCFSTIKNCIEKI
jgi:predicted ATP-grasp superfamily ATP-dependent carboligase/protein-tyrosine-phosphatase